MVTAPGAVGAAMTMPWPLLLVPRNTRPSIHSMRAFMMRPQGCRSASLVAEQVEEDAGVIIAGGDVQAVALPNLDGFRKEVDRLLPVVGAAAAPRGGGGPRTRG